METVGGVSAFANRLLTIMKRVEYRRVVSMEDMEDIARLRHKAYTRHNVLKINGDLLIDDMDFDKNAYVFGVYYDEQLVSTVRIHHVTPAYRVNSSGSIFPDVVESMLDAGNTLIDPARLAVDPDVFDDIPGVPYLAQRIVTMASDYFAVDKCLQLIKLQHAAFYSRVFQSQQIVEPVSDTGTYDFKVTLLAADVPIVLPKIYRRYPFFQSQLFEQRMMFGHPAEMGTLPLTILPTARYFAEAA